MCSTCSGSVGEVFQAVAHSCALLWSQLSGRRWLPPRAGQPHCRPALPCCSVDAHLQPAKCPLQNHFQQCSQRQPLCQQCRGLSATAAGRAIHRDSPSQPPSPPGVFSHSSWPCTPQWFAPKVAPGVHQLGAGQPWPHRESVRVHVAWCGLDSWLHWPPGLHTHHGHRLRTGGLGTCGSALAPCCPPPSPAGARQSRMPGSWLLGRLLTAALISLRDNCCATLRCLLQAARQGSRQCSVLTLPACHRTAAKPSISWMSDGRMLRAAAGLQHFRANEAGSHQAHDSCGEPCHYACFSSNLNTSCVFSSTSPGGTRRPLPESPLSASSPCCRRLSGSSQHSSGAFACLLLWQGNLHTIMGCLAPVEGRCWRARCGRSFSPLHEPAAGHLPQIRVWRQTHVHCFGESTSSLGERPVTAG